MKTIIAGSRDIFDFGLIEKAVKESGFKITEVVSGCARGVDTLGEHWAAIKEIPVKRFMPDWEYHGKSAAAIRNQQMADYAEACIVIHRNTPGSLDMLKKAKKKGLKVYEFIVI